LGTLTVPQMVKKSEAFYGILSVVILLVGVGHSTTEPNKFVPHS